MCSAKAVASVNKLKHIRAKSQFGFDREEDQSSIIFSGTQISQISSAYDIFLYVEKRKFEKLVFR
jgi:hypothetical protein